MHVCRLINVRVPCTRLCGAGHVFWDARAGCLVFFVFAAHVAKR